MSAAQVQPAIVGATGYTGYELARLLLRHGRAKKPLLLSRSAEGASGDLADSYPRLSGNGSLPLEPFSWERLRQAGVDVLFLCTPHEVSREWAPQALAQGLRVVDLSGAWRLKNGHQRSVYKLDDADAELAAAIEAGAAYGIPEVNRKAIAPAALVANAGCYATSIILALAPWLRDGLLARGAGIICDSKSGVSGAGKQPTPTTHFVEVSDNLSAYSVFGHRHTGEILEQLGLDAAELQFTPHLLPIPRGILSTIYAQVNEGVTEELLRASLQRFYECSPFVRVLDGLPQIKFSLHTNHCDLGFVLEPGGRRVVLISCLDNLMKGASGQAVQNMNVMFGFGEQEGLQ